MKIGVPLKGFAEFSRAVASQGTVLLKNDEKFFPLKKQEQVAVFGRCQFDYYSCGTGSGGAVNTEYTTDFINSLIERRKVIVNDALYIAYEDWLKDNPIDNGGGKWASEPWCQTEMPLTDEFVKEVSDVSEKAIIIIGRTAGEDKDNANEKGSYLLTDGELDMINKVCKYFDKVGVILNVSNIIDMSWENEKINAIIYAWQGGMEGGNAIVDVVIGNTTPSGKLPDTIATDIKYYPAHKDKTSLQNIYIEDIYVGYRYFETFAKDCVKYPFGYGLSYTEFSIEVIDYDIIGEITDNRACGIAVKVKVTNIGDKYSGKEVVQIYLEAPQGKLGQPSRKLVVFAKTRLLVPKENESITLFIPFYGMASFDDSGVTGYKSAYVLEAGSYWLHVGNSIRDNSCRTISFNISKCTVIKQLEEALAPTTAFKRMKPKLHPDNSISIDYEDVPLQTIDLAERINSKLPEEIELIENKGYKLKDVKRHQVSIEKFIAQLSLEDLETIVRGEGMSHPNVTPGTAAAFGGVSKKLRDLGIPLMCCADGPSGIRMGSGYNATLMPIATLLASTWDIYLIEMLYKMAGKEVANNGIDLLLGPGLNIHRSPLNGRNFEYYSEDPLLTSKIAAAAARGIRKGGAHATLKHFICNSQETNRRKLDAVVSTRALREVYLKGFEAAVKEAHAMAVMTAYNPVNGHWTASNYDLNTTILRDEWDFKGIVMTDWGAQMNDVIDGGEASTSNVANMIKSQNDLYMVVGNYGAEVNENVDNIAQYLQNDKLKISELQRSAINICKFALKTQAFERGRLLFGHSLRFPARIEKTYEGIMRLSDNILEITDKSQSFFFEDEGEYQLNITYSCNTKGVGQTRCNIFLNDIFLANIQTKNTNGKTITKKFANAKLEIGLYVLTLEFISDELEIKQIEFIKL
ncbi:beta-glucosidase [Candidatus Epulonipiscioides gigas]|nr:beta-glucosidase [Epulopiscium sp. SCG-C07WGA-EpuloA2]